MSVPAHFWPDVVGVLARCAAATVGFALLTAGLVLVTRSTVGGILVWFAYLVGIEGVLAAQVSGLREKLIIVNLAAFLDGHAVRFSSVGGSGGQVVVRPADGPVLLVAAVLVVVVLWVLVFRRRDVT